MEPARGRILYVEDDDDLRELLTLALMRGGHDVVGVGEASDALAALERRRFDIVMTDLWMPGPSGVALLDRARAQGLLAGAVTCVLTSDPEAAIGRADRVLVKPISTPALLDEVSSLLVTRRDRVRRARRTARRWVSAAAVALTVVVAAAFAGVQSGDGGGVRRPAPRYASM